MILTLKASILCLKICNKEYGKTHYKNNKANAFRHALWNILIIKKCNHYNNNIKKCIAWTKTITDWHETFSVNKDLERKMDIHNNEVGRNFYPKIRDFTLDEVIHFLKQEASEALPIKEPFYKKNYQNILVFISE